ncbi:outer membrane beta-barrel family protein [Pedobacter sp. SYSU D00535]|uniref:outer membrane beta-barrel family protein n=1 Tax=Pedobacter sp. SYSU D00535 TaxID=2810308 RepID=UPI001A97D25B|nr:outer membrane beta-barrel family protein [Pedobacter sp. SYSU D00535]
MKSYLLLFLLLSYIPAVLFAQTPENKYTIKASVIDSTTSEPIAFATAVLKKGPAVVQTTLSKEDGTLEFRNLPEGLFSLTIAFMGYRPTIQTIELSGKSNAVTDAGVIRIKNNTKTLKDVVVTGKKSLISQDIDKISYDIQADPDSKGQTMLEMISKIPLLTVDADDNVQLNGQSNFKILINGKPSGLTARSPKEALRSMQAANVLKVEVMTMPPAKYESEGVGGIINIITKKPAEGYNGLVGVFHNTLFGGGPWVNLGIKKGRFGMFGYADRYFTGNPGYSFENSRRTVSPQSYDQFHRGTSDRSGNVFYYNTEFTYELDSLNLLTASFGRYNEDSRQTAEQEFNIFSNEGTINSDYNLFSENQNDFSSLDWGANYQMGFKGNKERLLTTSYKYVRSSSNGIIDNKFNGGNLQDLYQQNESGTEEQTAQLDYFHPFKKITVEGGIKYITRENFSRSDATTASQNDDLQYLQNVLGLYNSYQIKLKNWGIKAGVRLERTNVKADFMFADDFKTTYTNLIPSFSIQRKYGVSSINLGYTQRIERPGIGQLNPFVNKNNPLNYSYGNPSLQAALTHNFELRYNRFKKANTTLSLNYAFADNTVQNVVFVREDSISVTTFSNIGKYDNYGFNFNYKYPVTKKFNTSFSGNVRLLSFEGISEGRSFKREGLQAFLGTNYSFNSEKGWNLSSSVNLASRFIKIQGETSGYISHSLNFNKDLFKKKATFSINLKNPFLKYRNVITELSTPSFAQYNNNHNYTRGLMVYYIQRFGKLKESIKKSKRGVVNDDVKKESSTDSN